MAGIQPPRGYSLQPQAIYHSPTLPPPPQYLAFYLWIRETFRAHAIAIAAGFPGITLISADNDVSAAAQAEGVIADNPNSHP